MGIKRRRQEDDVWRGKEGSEGTPLKLTEETGGKGERGCRVVEKFQSDEERAIRIAECPVRVRWSVRPPPKFK